MRPCRNSWAPAGPLEREADLKKNAIVGTRGFARRAACLVDDINRQALQKKD
jgi:hypothetical protein